MTRLVALAARVESSRRESTARDREWVSEINDAVDSALPPVESPRDAAELVKNLIGELRESGDETTALRSRVDRATRALGSLVKIEDACPLCGTRSLVIDQGGHLTCSLPVCRAEVAVAWRTLIRAAADLADAAGNAVKFSGGEHRDKLAAALAGYAAAKESR